MAGEVTFVERNKGRTFLNAVRSICTNKLVSLLFTSNISLLGETATCFADFFSTVLAVSNSHSALFGLWNVLRVDWESCLAIIYR